MRIPLGFLKALSSAFNWTTGTITSQVYRDATYANLANGKYFAFGMTSTGSSTTAYRYSTDGLSWSAGTLPASSTWRACATNGSRIIVVRGSSTTGYYTDNGTTWTVTGTVFASSRSPRNIIWDGTQFVTGEFNLGTTLRYSTDGTGTWSSATATKDGTIGYDGTSRYIVLDSSASNSTSASTTTTFPTGWSSVTLPSSNIWRSIAYGNGIWVAMNTNSNGSATSTNGTTWTSRSLPEAIGDSEHAKILFTNGKFYYYSSATSETIYSSTDGITWATEATVSAGTLNALNGWAAGDGKIIGVGWDSNVLGSTYTLVGS